MLAAVATALEGQGIRTSIAWIDVVLFRSPGPYNERIRPEMLFEASFWDDHDLIRGHLFGLCRELFMLYRQAKVVRGVDRTLLRYQQQQQLQPNTWRNQGDIYLLRFFLSGNEGLSLSLADWLRQVAAQRYPTAAARRRAMQFVRLVRRFRYRPDVTYDDAYPFDFVGAGEEEALVMDVDESDRVWQPGEEPQPDLSIGGLRI